MDSRFRLNILDAQIEREFGEHRSKEIMQGSILMISIKTLQTIVILAGQIYYQKVKLVENLFRVIALFLHLIVIVMNKRYPLKVYKYHSPLSSISLIFIQLGYFFYGRDEERTCPLLLENLLNQAAGMVLCGMQCLLCNSAWISSTVSFLIYTALQTIIQNVWWNFFSLKDSMARLLIVVVMPYIFWQFESKSKQEFIQMAEIKKMNQELKIILTKHMPDAIMLIAKEQNQTQDAQPQSLSLINDEFRRILKIQEQDDFDAVLNLVKSKILRPIKDVLLRATAEKNPTNQNFQGQQSTFSQESPGKNQTAEFLIDNEKQSGNIGTPYIRNVYSDTQLGNIMLDKQTGEIQEDKNSQLISIMDIVENCPSSPPLKSEEDERYYSIITDDTSINSNGRPIEPRVVIIKNQQIFYQGKTVCMIVLRDVSRGVKYERLKLHSQLADMLTATISHDMRTPLNAIISVSKTLIQDVAQRRGSQSMRRNQSKKMWTRFLQIVYNSATLLNYQVNDLIDLFKIRTQKFKSYNSIGNISEIVKEIFEVFSIQTNEKGLELNMQSEQNFPQLLYLDCSRFKQVLVNLIANSLKFTFEGSIKVILGYDLDSEKLQVTVTDTGIGINDADKHRIFDMFSKIETTLTTNTSGIGMGLSITSKILSGLGGTIQIEPQYNRSMIGGTSIIFTMNAIHVQLNQQIGICTIGNSNNTDICEPAQIKFDIGATSDISDMDSDSQIDEPVGPSGIENNLNTSCPYENFAQILVVDDNVFNILALEVLLQCKGITLIERALNGEEAVRSMEQRLEHHRQRPCRCKLHHKSDYQIIFMDCNMPVMDGFEATKRILQIAPKASIVTLTAYSTEEFKQKCMNAGMKEFLTKPLNEEKLSNLLKAVGLIQI